MKQNILKRGLIFTLLLTLILSSTCFAYADEQTKWVPKASMSTGRNIFQTQTVNGKLYAIGGYNGSTLASMEQYDPKTEKWIPRQGMLSPRHNFETVVLNGKIYAMGGFGTTSDLNTVEEYDPDTDIWTPKTPMKFARQSLQTLVLDGKIYAIGGLGSDAVEVYDPGSNSWDTKQHMNSKRTEFQTEVISGKIYAIGGNVGGGIVKSMEVYDPENNIWTDKAPMNGERMDFQTKVIGGKIYAIGGCDSTGKAISTVEMYDPSNDKWNLEEPMKNPRYTLQTELVNGEIYAIGGYDGKSGVSAVEKYNPVTNHWSDVASLNSPRGYLETEVIDGKIYAVGGSPDNPYVGSSYLSVTTGNSLTSLEELAVGQSSETLTVTASPNKVKINQEFTTNIAIHNETNICAEDMKITYDTSLFTYEGAVGQTGTKIYKEDTSTPGTIRFITACQGKDTAATGDKGLITLKFKAKAKGIGKVDIIKGRIADNATLEKDVDDANCGEDTITVDGYSDVNRSGSYTLLDLGIDAWYDGMNAADTDSTKFDADVITDGKIDDNDLTKITQEILANTDYTPNK